MNILVLGSGGREHALCWKIAASPLTTKLWCAPGNAGIAQDAECVGLDVSDHAAVIAFCRENGIDLVVVGPDALIAAGIVDDLTAAGVKTFGPTQAAGKLESSKSFTKQLCRDNDIPTAAYAHFTDAVAAKAYVRAQGVPIVVKADGLAAGKGVVVAMTLDEALAAIDMMFGGGFGEAGAEVVIEEFMVGEEASFFALCDGEHALPLATAQDHKRAFDGDKGPNTGGMGAYSPVPAVGPDLVDDLMERAVAPTLAALGARGIDYRGVLYAGLMLTPDGPKVLEYNVRFGDPETQVVLPRMTSDLASLLAAAADGALGDDPGFDDGAAVTVVCASEGYPASPRTGDPIEGLEQAAEVEGVTVFCAGVGANDHGRLTTAGGRVLTVTGQGDDLASARSRAYEAVGHIRWPGMQVRSDIAASPT